MSTRSGRLRTSVVEVSPPRTRKGVSPTRSPARTRKSSPPSRKSPPPARSSARKSPARKSPSRKPASKFPARKSPSRATKKVEKPPAVPKSPAKPLVDDEVAVQLEDIALKLEVYRSTRSKRLDYSIKDVSSTTHSEVYSTKLNGIETDVYSSKNRKPIEEVVPRRSSRLREFIDDAPVIRRSISKSLSQSKSISKSVSKSIDTYSDEEGSEKELLREKSRSVTRKLATPLRSSISNLTKVVSKWEFGGRIGSALLLLLMPLTVFSILFSCRQTCSLYFWLNISECKSLETWFSLKSLYFVSAQILIQAIIAILPIFGTRSERMDETGSKYCFNAFFAATFTVSILFLTDFFELIKKDDLLNEFIRLAVISYIFAVLLSIGLYGKSRKVDNDELNPYGNTGYKLYDYFMGREIHPYIGPLNVKVCISRICNINSLILLSIIFSHGIKIKMAPNAEMAPNVPLSIENYKELLNKVQLNSTLLVYTTMQIVYVLYFVVREYRVTSTFFWQSEGVGYLQTVASALYPFYFTVISKHVADTRMVLSTNILVLASVLYSLGFFVMLFSNNIKHEFRSNPLHLSLANVDSMPTFHGKKLLVSGLWGILRHPNYTGDILMHIALATPGLLSGHLMAALPAVLTVFVLLHRAWRDHDRCKRRYGAAWQRYCKRVTSVIIPKVL